MAQLLEIGRVANAPRPGPTAKTRLSGIIHHQAIEKAFEKNGGSWLGTSVVKLLSRNLLTGTCDQRKLATFALGSFTNCAQSIWEVTTVF